MTIHLEPADDDTRALWQAVGELVDRLPGEWVLVGGLMVQLHGAEAGMTDIRPTRDIDVLAPDGIRPAPTLAPGISAIGIPGGSQALTRAELVEIDVDGRLIRLRRPTLLGAILIKARSLVSHADPDTQREDLIRLLSLVDDPRLAARELKKSERRWLRDVEARLDLDGFTRLDPAVVRRARLAYRLLTA